MTVALSSGHLPEIDVGRIAGGRDSFRENSQEEEDVHSGRQVTRRVIKRRWASNSVQNWRGRLIKALATYLATLNGTEEGQLTLITCSTTGTTQLFGSDNIIVLPMNRSRFPHDKTTSAKPELDVCVLHRDTLGRDARIQLKSTFSSSKTPFFQFESFYLFFIHRLDSFGVQ